MAKKRPLKKSGRNTSAKKAKISSDTDSTKAEEHCLIHFDGISHGKFTRFSNINVDPKERLKELHNTRDLRLSEPADSPKRMEDVCLQISESIDEYDLECTGYHRGCYQKFNNHKPDKGTNALENSSQVQRSPRKASTSTLFSPECVFCEIFKKKVDGQTERCTHFPVFKNKSGGIKTLSWQLIEPRALEMRKMKLS